MPGYFFTIVLLLVGFYTTTAQEQQQRLQLKLATSIPGNFADFYVDNMGNLYLINAGRQIKKINAQGDSVAVFNDVRRYGNLYAMDVTNPLKIVAYYKDFSTVLLLDRFLTVRKKIDLRASGIVQVKSVALSYDGNLWLYDEADAKLKKLDENGKLLFESSDFRLIFPQAPEPARLIDYNGLLYLYDEKQGWFVFDYHGALKTRLPFGGWADVQVKDAYIAGRQNGFLLLYYENKKQLIKKTLELAAGEIIKTQLQANKMFILTSGGLSGYIIE